MRFGGVWTAVIVTQVAVTVAFPASAFFARRAVSQVRSAEAGFAADAYVAGRLEMSPEFVRGGDDVIRSEFPAARFTSATAELARRLKESPEVVHALRRARLPAVLLDGDIFEQSERAISCVLSDREAGMHASVSHHSPKRQDGARGSAPPNLGRALELWRGGRGLASHG